MAITKEEISNYFDQGVKNKYDYLFIVCDTFDYEDFPVYVKKDDYQKEFDRIRNAEMTSITEVYDLSKDKQKQLNEYRAFNGPR